MFLVFVLNPDVAVDRPIWDFQKIPKWPTFRPEFHNLAKILSPPLKSSLVQYTVPGNLVFN